MNKVAGNQPINVGGFTKWFASGALATALLQSAEFCVAKLQYQSVPKWLNPF